MEEIVTWCCRYCFSSNNV